MRLPKHLCQIVQYHSRLHVIAHWSEFSASQRFFNARLTGHPNRIAITECAQTLAGRIQFVQRRIEYNANFRLLVDKQCNGNAGVRVIVHKIHGAINRVDYPCWFVIQFIAIAVAAILLADEPVKYTFGQSFFELILTGSQYKFEQCTPSDLRRSLGHTHI